MLPDFDLQDGKYSTLFKERGIHTFLKACQFVQALPYERISNKENYTLVLTEGRGTCSSKHGLLASLAEEQHKPEIELMAGIFIMSPETHPQLEAFFKDKPYTVLPEMHCYLRYEKERYDFTSMRDLMPVISSKFTREQRIEPHQAGAWKQKIHQHYIEAWLERNPQIGLTFDEIWSDREQCIALLSENDY